MLGADFCAGLPVFPVFVCGFEVVRDLLSEISRLLHRIWPVSDYGGLPGFARGTRRAEVTWARTPRPTAQPEASPYPVLRVLRDLL
jgi:hypothetical protein